MRYCIFGGFFNPPHEGHRYLARSARDTLHLDKVFWVPAPDPPHKQTPATPFRHRLAMAALAVAGEQGQAVSDVEERLPRPSYSLRTIEAMKAEHGPGHAWHLLVGADNWATFQAWHRWQEVLREVTLVVFPRAGTPLGQFPPGVLRLDMPEWPAQSRDIREVLRATGDMQAAGVLPELREYIRAHGLYGMERRGAGREATR